MTDNCTITIRYSTLSRWEVFQVLLFGFVSVHWMLMTLNVYWLSIHHVSIGYMHTNSVELYNILHSCWLHIEPTLIIRVYIWYVNVIYISYTHTSACQLPCWPTLITVFILYCIILYTLSSIYYTDLYGLYVICRGHSSRPEWRNGWWVAARGRLIAASFLWGLHGSETYITYIVHIYIYELVLDRHNVKRKHVMVFRLIWMKKLLEISIVWLFVIFQIFGRCWGHQSTILCGFGLCLLISTQTLDWWPRSARTCH